MLVSRTRTSADHNTRIMGGDDLVDRLAAFKASTDGRIDVGGATLATELLRAELLDELRLETHLTILESGRPLFDDHQRPVQLELLEQKMFGSGA